MVVYCNDLMHEIDIAFWEDAHGRRIEDGDDITEILSTPHDIWGGDVVDYALCGGYEGKYGATVVRAHGPGGGNPYVRFEWCDMDTLREWYVKRVGAPIGMDRETSLLELEYVLSHSR